MTGYRSSAEAAYIVALLNADGLQRAFVESRESGRHFHLHPWRKVPIPRFSVRNRTHRAVAALGIAAEERVAEWLAGTSKSDLQLQQIGKSARIRGVLRESGLMGRINVAASRLLPDHVCEDAS